MLTLTGKLLYPLGRTPTPLSFLHNDSRLMVLIGLHACSVLSKSLDSWPMLGFTPLAVTNLRTPFVTAAHHKNRFWRLWPIMAKVRVSVMEFWLKLVYRFVSILWEIWQADCTGPRHPFISVGRNVCLSILSFSQTHAGILHRCRKLDMHIVSSIPDICDMGLYEFLHHLLWQVAESFRERGSICRNFFAGPVNWENLALCNGGGGGDTSDQRKPDRNHAHNADITYTL
jgi:hypothetical protein